MITLSKLDLGLGVVILLLVNFLIYNHYFRARVSISQASQQADIHDIIEKVRSELKQADEDRIRRNDAALFEVKSFDLEINFIAKTTEKQEGGVKTELIAISGGSESSLERLQKITLHLETVPPINMDIPPSSDAEKPTSTKK
jgi:hypothetical protein